MPILPQRHRARFSNSGIRAKLAGIPQDNQLQLVAQSDTEPAIEPFRSACKAPGGEHYWQFRCRQSRRKYGGLYTASERDLLVAHFASCSDVVGSREFGAIAAMILRGAKS